MATTRKTNEKPADNTTETEETKNVPAQKKTDEKPEKPATPSPLRRVVKVELEMEVEGVVYSGTAEEDSEGVAKAMELATEWAELQRLYSEKTEELKAQLEEIGLEEEVSVTAKRSGGGGGSKHSPEFLKKVRGWAKSVNKEVSDRGRIPAAIIQEYDDAKKAGHVPSQFV